LDSRIGEGACVVARKFVTASARSSEVAILGRPYPGEAISGDDGVFIQSAEGLLAAVCDGLGHGPEARRASNRAVECVCAHHDLPLKDIVEAVNREVTDTRGCVLSLARFQSPANEIECIALGDVNTQIYGPSETHFLVPVPMVLRGAEIPKRNLRSETVRLERETVLVMFTDGLSSKTSLKRQLAVLRQPPVAIAQHLMENDARATDDALVLVARLGSQISQASESGRPAGPHAHSRG
jgi:serine/threonine protein phosphatase PrpC